MWPSVFIALLGILILSAYTIGIPTSEVGPLQPPECGLSNVTLRRIVGGQPAMLGAWPWMTALGYESGNPAKPNWWCGGSLISKRHVLTASHCLLAELYLIRIGDLDLNDDTDVAQPFQDNIQSINSHAEYNPVTYTNDIAVLKTTKEVPFTSVLHPICLPIDDKIKNRNLDNLYAMTAGWGRIYYQGPYSSKLLQTQVPIVTEQKCKEGYKNIWNSVIDSRVMCAGSPGISPCNADSGGPLMVSSVDNQKLYYVVGVVSSSYLCAAPNYPTIFTRVTGFLDFIIESMKKLK